VYCQPTEITGISMLGKMSVGVRRITTGAAMRIRSARTINVYGRFSATLTIHIIKLGASFPQKTHYCPTFNLIPFPLECRAVLSVGFHRKNRYTPTMELRHLRYLVAVA